MSKTADTLGFIINGITTYAETRDSADDWTNIEAQAVGAIIDGDTVYGGRIMDSNLDGFTLVEWGKAKVTSDSETSTIASKCERLRMSGSLTPTINYVCEGNGVQGMVIVSDEFALNESRTISIKLHAVGSLVATTEAGMCWAGFGWKFTSNDYLSTTTRGYVDAISNQCYDGLFATGISGHPWTDANNIGTNTLCTNGFNGVLLPPEVQTGPNGRAVNYTKTINMTVPAGKSHLCVYFVVHASGGDTAQIVLNELSYEIEDTNSTGTTPHTFTIIQSDNQTITVTCGGVSHTETFTCYSGASWTATVTPASGYVAGTLTATSGTISGSTTLYASAAKVAHTFTITQSSNQTITVTCDGVSYTETFTCKEGDTWTATIAASSGYTAGTLTATSGTITGDTSISASAATSSGSTDEGDHPGSR